MTYDDATQGALFNYPVQFRAALANVNLVVANLAPDDADNRANVANTLASIIDQINSIQSRL